MHWLHTEIVVDASLIVYRRNSRKKKKTETKRKFWAGRKRQSLKQDIYKKKLDTRIVRRDLPVEDKANRIRTCRWLRILLRP